MKQTFMTKTQLADELGMHVNTLRRKLQERGVAIRRGLLSPETQEDYKQKLQEWEANNAVLARRDLNTTGRLD